QVESSDCPGVDTVVDRLQQIWTHVVDNLTLSQEKAQRFANRRRCVGPRLRVGDLVWLSSRFVPMKVSSPKFKPRFIGPYKISEVINPVSFRLALPASFAIHNVFHRSLLRRYVAPVVPSVDPPAPVLVEGELEYVVEKILDSRISRRKLQYLVKWKGYGQEENSWVFASDVHAADLLAIVNIALLAGSSGMQRGASAPADQVRLRQSRSMKTRRGRHRKKIGGPGPDCDAHRTRTGPGPAPGQILKILSAYLTNLRVLTVGLQALTIILESDVIHLLVLDHEADVFLLIFEAMKLFPDKEDIQIYGCQALYLLLMKGGFGAMERGSTPKDRKPYSFKRWSPLVHFSGFLSLRETLQFPSAAREKEVYLGCCDSIADIDSSSSSSSSSSSDVSGNQSHFPEGDTSKLVKAVRATMKLEDIKEPKSCKTLCLKNIALLTRREWKKTDRNAFTLKEIKRKYPFEVEDSETWVPEEQLTEFVESKDHLIILKVLTQYKDTESVIYQALRVLIPLAGPPCNVEVLMSGNVRCYNIIMEAMKTFPNCENIQEVCCCLFQKLTFGSFFNILVLNEAHDVIIKALISYSANSRLQATALTCMALLTETIFLNKDLDDGEDAGNIKGQLYWFEASFKALKLHKKNPEVQVGKLMRNI
ncbi:unnamed protein product, partial [Ranitomeya imitator]